MTKLLTLREVIQMTALSRSVVYALMGAAQFPQPVRIGRRAVRWVKQEVLDFIASRSRVATLTGVFVRAARPVSPVGTGRPARQRRAHTPAHSFIRWRRRSNRSERA